MLDSFVFRVFPWFIIAGVPLVGIGILWAALLTPVWPAWAFITAGFLVCLPVWIEWAWQEFTPRT